MCKSATPSSASHQWATVVRAVAQTEAVLEETAEAARAGAATAEVAFLVQGAVARAVVVRVVVAEKRVALAATVVTPEVRRAGCSAAGRPAVYWAEEVWAEDVKVEEEVAGAATVAANLVGWGDTAVVVVDWEGTVAEMEAVGAREVLADARAAVEGRDVETVCLAQRR